MLTQDARTRGFTLSRLTLLVALAAIACQPRPVPLTVAAGTSFFLPVPGSAYGSALGNAHSRQDYQRGDLVAALCPADHPELANCPSPVYLTTTYVTSVMPDPASPAGIRGFMEFYSYGAQWPLAGQGLAIFGVPASVTPGVYALSMRTRPQGNAPGVGEVIANDQPGNIQIGAAVAPGSQYGLTDPNVTARVGGATGPGGLDLDISGDLADLIPYPTVVAALANEGDTFVYPAAFSVEVSYPASVAIKGVYEDGHLGRHSLVSMSDNTSTRRVTISSIDPERCTTAIRIAYDLVAAGPPVATSSFSVVTSSSYDLNGAPQGNSFVIATSSARPGGVCGPH
jgi:hypothetical protein